MKFLSVCSGIEAASAAWNPLGWGAVAFSEIEPFPSAVLAHHYPDVPNIGDMTKLLDLIPSGAVEAPDVFCGGTPCFTAGHMVLTASGYRAIEDLAPGDEVMTHKGRLRKILRVGSKAASVGHLSAVGMPDGITCTADHPFLSSHWRNQSTRRDGLYAKVETCSEPEWVAAKELPGRQWCALTQAEPIACKPESRLFDERTAMYVAGMYLGDGWLRRWNGKKKRAVILGINEAKYQKLLAVIGQADHSISRERTVIKVSFGDTAFANWLEANFGRQSHLKTLPAWVLGHPHRDALLQGYMDTDGCVDGCKVTINSTSESLAHGVCDLLNIQGWATSVAKMETAATCVIEGRTVNQRDYFQVRANHLSTSRKARVCHGYLMRTVQAWELAGEAMVFNIEVEDDNSFILAGAVVHNCQAFSVAGLRKSLDDARGNLSLVFCEIANAIDAARAARGDEPAIIFWENVPGVLSTKDNAFGCFLAGLAGEDDPLVAPGGKWTNAGCVYGPQRAVAWRVLDAQYFGVAQRRRRVFVVASARENFDPASVLFEFDGVRRDFAPSRKTGQETAAGTLRGTQGGSDADHARAGHIQPSAFGGNRTSGPIDISPALNACASASASGRMDFESEAFLVQPTHTLRAEGFDASEDGTGRGTPLVPHIVGAPACNTGPNGHDAGNFSCNQAVDAGHVLPVVYATKLHNTTSNQAGKFYENYTASLDANSPPPAIVFDTTQITSPLNFSNPKPGDPSHPLAAGAHAPAIAFNWQGGGTQTTLGYDPDSGISSTLSAGQTPAIAFSAKDYGADATNDLAPTLRAMNHAESHANGGGQMAVRRLLPVECEKLQGFPPGYTAIPWRKKPASECPDGPRYKALGNSWAVPVIAWIGRRIAAAVAAQQLRHEATEAIAHQQHPQIRERAHPTRLLPTPIHHCKNRSHTANTMTTKTRLYKVDTPAGPRLIEARSQQHAIVYVIRKDRQGMTASLPPQHEIYALARAGVEIEIAHGVDGISEGSEADLAQSTIDV